MSAIPSSDKALKNRVQTLAEEIIKRQRQI